MSEITKPGILNETGVRIAEALEAMTAEKAPRVASLDNTPLAVGTVIEAVGAPVYVKDVTQYSAFGITETGWYVFARISAPDGVSVTNATTITGAAGYIATVGEAHVDVAVRFDTMAQSRTVTIEWCSGVADAYVFRATDLAVRNLDYRVTFYVYDAAPYVRWEYGLTTDATYAANKSYYAENDGEYLLIPYTAGEAVPAYYVTEDEGATYAQATGVFQDGVTYYTKSGDTYTAAEVTVGDKIPAIYVHTKVIFEGLVRNITYRLDTIIDCPMEFILPEIENETHGCWFEIRCQHAGEYSMTLTPPAGVKVATEHTQKETAGINMINLHYTVIGNTKIWRFLNTHSSIPADSESAM